MSKRPTLSICYMVRNEIEVLERSLSSVKHWADEICITDTGSDDGTRLLAQGYADRYQEIEWPNHFARARNESLRIATSDFVLVLDADEEIEDPGRAFAELRHFLQPQIIRIILEVKNVIGEMTDAFWQPRVFRRGAVTYRGRVHHQPEVKGEGKTVKVDRCKIIHSGYDLTDEGRRRKYGPRLSMLAQLCDEADTPRKSAYARYQHGIGLYLGGYARAALARLAGINADDLNDGGRGAFNEKMHRASVMAQCYLVMHRDGIAFNAEEAAGSAARLSAYDNPDALLKAGQVAAMIGQDRECLFCFCRAYVSALRGGVRTMPPESVAKRVVEVLMALHMHDEAYAVARDPAGRIPAIVDMMRGYALSTA